MKKRTYSVREAAKKINISYKKLLYMIEKAPRDIFYAASGVKRLYMLTGEDVAYFMGIIEMQRNSGGLTLPKAIMRYAAMETSSDNPIEDNGCEQSDLRCSIKTINENIDKNISICEGMVRYDHFHDKTSRDSGREILRLIESMRGGIVTLQYMCIVLLVLLGCLVVVGSMLW